MKVVDRDRAFEAGLQHDRRIAGGIEMILQHLSARRVHQAGIARFHVPRTLQPLGRPGGGAIDLRAENPPVERSHLQREQLHLGQLFIQHGGRLVGADRRVDGGGDGVVIAGP